MSALSVFVFNTCMYNRAGVNSLLFPIKNKNAMTEKQAGMNSNNCFVMLSGLTPTRCEQ